MNEDPFYIGEITPDKRMLFVNRESDLNLVLYGLSGNLPVAIPVIGDIGTGKTSFLNIIQYYLEVQGIKSKVIKAKDVLEGAISKDGKVIERNGVTRAERVVDVLLVDDIEKLDESKAIEIYRNLEVLTNRMKVVFTCRREWLAEEKKIIRDVIRWLSTVRGSYIYLDLTPDEMAYFIEERFRRLKDKGYENRFDHEALILAAKRANKNLRTFFQYCRVAYLLRREGKITVEVMKDIILEEDLGIIEGMGEIEKNILRILITEGEKSNTELKAALREIMEEGFRNDTYYNVRRDLERDGFIKVGRVGKRTIIKDVYRDFHIEITAEMIDKAGFYARKIRDFYMRDRTQELMFSSGGQVE